MPDISNQQIFDAISVLDAKVTMLDKKVDHIKISIKDHKDRDVQRHTEILASFGYVNQRLNDFGERFDKKQQALAQASKL